MSSPLENSLSVCGMGWWIERSDDAMQEEKDFNEHNTTRSGMLKGYEHSFNTIGLTSDRAS